MSISKAEIKYVKSLQMQKFRQSYHKFVAEGDKVCLEFLKNKKFVIDTVFVSNVLNEVYTSFIHDADCSFKIISQAHMDQISGLKTPSEILMILDMRELTSASIIQLNSYSRILYLDGVQDPGNVGTIIRIADWFGIEAIVRSDQSADFYNPKVVQASMGSMVNIHTDTAELQDLKNICPHHTIYGTMLHGTHLNETVWSSKAILVMGSEGHGVNAENIALLDSTIHIPGHKSKIADSLNVGVATGILCARWCDSY